MLLKVYCLFLFIHIFQCAYPSFPIRPMYFPEFNCISLYAPHARLHIDWCVPGLSLNVLKGTSIVLRFSLNHVLFIPLNFPRVLPYINSHVPPAITGISLYALNVPGFAWGPLAASFFPKSLLGAKGL